MNTFAKLPLLSNIRYLSLEVKLRYILNILDFKLKNYIWIQFKLHSTVPLLNFKDFKVGFNNLI